jgi:hypothetical protein
VYSPHKAFPVEETRVNDLAFASRIDGRDHPGQLDQDLIGQLVCIRVVLQAGIRNARHADGTGRWVAGELATRPVRLPGPTVLRGGQAATFAGVTGVPRLALSIAFLALVAGALWRWRPAHRWQWNAPRLGIALGW